MNLSATLKYNRLREDAEKQFDLADSQLNQLENTLVERMGGRTKSKLVTTIVIGFLWLVIFPAGAIAMNWRAEIATIVNIAALGTSFVLALLMAFTNLALYKHYSVILAALDRIKELHNQVSLGRGAIPSGMDMLNNAQSSRFNMQIQATPSVIGEVKSIDGQLANLEAMHSGFVKGIQKFLYYLAGFAWTGAGYFIFGQLALNFMMKYELSDGFARILMIVGLLGALFAEWMLMVAAKKGSEVTNLSLLAVAAGPLTFGLTMVVVILAIGLLWLAWQIVKWVLLIAVGGAILLGLLGGG